MKTSKEIFLNHRSNSILKILNKIRLQSYNNQTNNSNMTKSEIFDQLTTQWEAFSAAHHSTKKKDAGEARKALGEIKKLVTPYRAASVEEAKKA